MFTVYYSNQIAQHKDLLIEILKNDPNPDPFSQETVLVQSLGMAQWLQMQITEQIGIVGNIQFPYPTSFLWQQYRLLFPELPTENIFERNSLIWRLMRLIPDYLSQAEFSPLKHYLMPQESEIEQLKLYQLASKIADLFDQYLVYRPQWLVYWENNQLEPVLTEIQQSISFKAKDIADIQLNMQWQSILWNALVSDIKSQTSEIIFNTSHRAYLQQRYFEKLENLTELEKRKLPKRIFVFGISSLPQTQLAVLKKLSEHCYIHLFFTNPSESYWANDREDKTLEKLALKQQLSTQELEDLFDHQGNPLLTTWGKQGKEFLNLLTENELQSIDLFVHSEQENLLSQIKRAILISENRSEFEFNLKDNSIQIHSCHNKMREVEVLHNQLLKLFEQNPDLSPKDIIVMSADIDSYAPYINAVFGNYARKDPRYIPFALSDQKISYVDPIIASFLTLLAMKEQQFSAEEILDLFDISAIREQYQLTEIQLSTLREWIKSAGIRAGLNKENSEWRNYNSWENGLNRLLLGTSLKSENYSWQDTLAFDESYGLAAELAGSLAKFLENVTAWKAFINEPHSIIQWKEKLIQLISQFYAENSESSSAIANLTQAIETVFSQISQANFGQELDIEVIHQCFIQQLSEQRNNLNFLIGKVNFCTLLPMRAIPFKVVCLLGMNEGDFPRQQVVNHFDLMQYAPQKGDRAKRDDDRYLFLEALLSAEQIFYISYIGQSLTDNAEKFPSILVSQLIDYIQECLPENTKLNIVEHPMTVFSSQNFINGNIAYDKEWLKAKNQTYETDQFLQDIVAEIPTEIELAELIRYLQSPLKYFFNRQLAIYLEDNEQAIEPSEHFNLSGLDQFTLLDELLNVDLTEAELFFENAKLQGNLPACHFAEISEKDLTLAIQYLKSTLSPYLAKQNEVIEIDQQINIGSREIRLVGNIPNRFDDEVIQWRAGKLRDKDMIQAWIYYLVLQATQQNITQFRFYYRDKQSVGCLQFNPISAELAMQFLSQYLNDYLASFHQLKWAINENLAKYLENSDDEKTSAEQKCQTALQNSDDLYVQRVLIQSAQLDYHEIHQRTVNWFTPMMQHIR